MVDGNEDAVEFENESAENTEADEFDDADDVRNDAEKIAGDGGFGKDDDDV